MNDRCEFCGTTLCCVDGPCKCAEDDEVYSTKWELVSDNKKELTLWRIQVPEGWIVSELIEEDESFSSTRFKRASICYVPDKGHQWKIRGE